MTSKLKLLNAALIFTSLIGYLEWGRDTHMFLFQIESEILSKLFTDPVSVFHPFVLLPLFGQIILLITLFQKQPSRSWSLVGMWSLAVLLLFILFIGLLGMKMKILSSAIPFFLVFIFSLRNFRKMKADLINRKTD
ncbi:MAG TPA: hypothetical protein PKK99_01830 [Bacteroidia bacterium]|nr:hypothetical protein [Bacteroidia bacterium]HNP97762.1 hypothetical protein [Bacteroidia bacterium]